MVIPISIEGRDPLGNENARSTPSKNNNGKNYGIKKLDRRMNSLKGRDGGLFRKRIERFLLIILNTQIFSKLTIR
jgi:hypothetical protein